MSVPATPEHEVFVVEAGHPTRERIGDAVLTGEVNDAVGVYVPEAVEAFDVGLLIDQCSDTGNGRHALARLTTEQARRVAARLVELANAVDDDRGARVLPGQRNLLEGAEDG